MNIQAELISIGTELLCGRTLNTHGRDLGDALNTVGLELVRDTTVPDDLSTIAATVNDALHRVGLVFVSGGLGPTTDDITRDALAGLLHQNIVIHQPTVEHLKQWYEQRGSTITLAATRQAQVLENAVVLPNSEGAAPGQRIDLEDDKTLFVLPGPPKEFNAILDAHIVPWIKQTFSSARPKLVRLVRTRGIGESDIVTILEAAGFKAENVDLGFYPGMGKVEIRLTADPDHKALIASVEQDLLHLLRNHLATPDQ